MNTATTSPKKQSSQLFNLSIEYSLDCTTACIFAWVHQKRGESLELSQKDLEGESEYRKGDWFSPHLMLG